jgi:hypothetical protein
VPSPTCCCTRLASAALPDGRDVRIRHRQTEVAMAPTRVTCLFAICVVVLLAGCATPRVQGGIDSLARPDASSIRNYILLPGNKDTQPADLQFQEYATYIHRALAARGFVHATNFETADLILFLSYGIGDPQTHQYTYALPMWGQTGYSGSTTSGTVTRYGNYGTYSGTTTYTPTFGVTGYTAQVGSYTTYFRYFLLDAYDLNAYKRDQKLSQVWRSTVTSVGASGDLRRVFPVMVAASADHLATNTGQKVNFALKEHDPSVSQIRGDRPK